MTTDVPLRAADSFLQRLVFGRADKRARDRADFVSKYDDYIAAATLLANALASPRSNASRSSAGRALDWLAAKLDLLSSDAQDEMMSRMLFPAEHKRHEAMLRDFIHAQSRLGTVAPLSVRREIKATSELLVHWSQSQDEELTDDWLERRKQLQRAADAHLRPAWRRWLRRQAA